MSNLLRLVQSISQSSKLLAQQLVHLVSTKLSSMLSSLALVARGQIIRDGMNLLPTIITDTASLYSPPSSCPLPSSLSSRPPHTHTLLCNSYHFAHPKSQPTTSPAPFVSPASNHLTMNPIAPMSIVRRPRVEAGEWAVL
jgi:hypothetical protein